MTVEFPCLGLQFLGMCSYNPANPGNVYFDMGGAIAALGFILAIQQLLKPIYQFRLRAYGVQFWHLTLCIFVGFLAVVVAALLPNLPIGHDRFWQYPIVWELTGSMIIAVVYAFAAYLILRPTWIKDFNLITFVRAAGALLSEARDDDRVKFAADLSHNIESLFKYAKAWDRAEWHGMNVEFERLRSIGAELSITGRPPLCAFYLFTHRRALERASFAGTLFRLMADVKFCSILVRECPWHTASIVNKIGMKKLHVDQAESFIQELARQALLNEESMMVREIGYDGFGQAPLLSESLFADPFILRAYRPLNKLMFERKTVTSVSYIARLNAASAMMLETALDHHGYWGAEYMYDVEKSYESVSQKLGRSKTRESEDDYPEVEWQIGIHRLCEMLSQNLKELEPTRRKQLFVKERDKHRNDLVHIISSIVYKSLESIANSFEDYDGRFWTHAIGTFMDLYPSHGEPDGMDPLQQHLAIQLVEKLQDNMNGWYPSISKVLLGVIGPYKGHPQVTNRTAYVILRDAVYKELQKLPALYALKPEKFADYLPANVTYDPATNTLTHRYSDGHTVATNLTELVIPDVDLLDETNWQT